MLLKSTYTAVASNRELTMFLPSILDLLDEAEREGRPLYGRY